jgi:hypothetical protein
LTVFSQTDTSSLKKTDTSVVILPKPVAIEVIKELMTKDYLSEENSLLTSTNYLLTKSTVYKDSILSIKDNSLSLCKTKELYYSKMLQLKDTQLVSNQKMIDRLAKDNVKLNKRLSFSRSAAIVFLVTATIIFGIK